MSTPLNRPILAAAPSKEAGGGSAQPPNQPSHVGPKPKRTLIESACVACRKRKSKCDGQRPTCSRCQSLRTGCVYEAQEGESRWSALRRRKRDIESNRDDMRELLTFLQLRPEAEALEILQRIRSSGFDDLLRLIRHARDDGQAISSQSLSAPSNPTNPQRLPSIRSMLIDPTQTDAQDQAYAGPSSGRQERLPSLSSGSDGSGESYPSSNLSTQGLRRVEE